MGTGSGRQRSRRRSVRLPLAAIAAVALTLALPAVGAHGLPTLPRGTFAIPHPAVACGSGSIPTNFTGSLVTEGTASAPPSVANRTVQLSYYYLLNYTPKGGSSSYLCKSGNATSTTDSVGGFTETAAVPTSSCNPTSCSVYSGPFGAASFAVVGGAPAGYFLTSHRTGAIVSLDFVEALASVALSPSIRITLSTDAPTVIAATPTAGDGTRSPATVTFAWQLVGTGWSAIGGTGTSNLTIEAFDQALPGVLSLWVNGTYNGTALSAPEVQLDIAAVTTTASPGQADPTSTDVGLPVTFTVLGTGAIGYAYNAVVQPGLGATATSIPCAAVDVAGGKVDLTCVGSLPYASPGTAQPSGNLTNGFSAAPVAFAAIQIAPALVVGVSPSPSLSYVGTPFGVNVSADPASGTAPFGVGCLTTGDGRTLCDAGPGPRYAFSVEYGTVGSYAGRASVVDETGANDTAPFLVQVVARPTLTPLVTSTNTPGVGQTANFSAVVTGGALPFAYWWNETTGSGTPDTLFAGSQPVDGAMTFGFVPYLAGPATITLTVVDRLRTVQSVVADLHVGPGAVASMVAAGPESGTVAAGAPYPISWVAVDAAGNRVPAYSGVVGLQVSSTGGSPVPPFWVNQTGSAPTLASSGVYPLNVTNGWLNLSVTVAGAGDFLLQFLGSIPLPGLPTPGIDELTVTPELSSARLVDPIVAVSGARSNATLWRLTDRFGDAFVGADVLVRSFFDGTTSDGVVAALVDGNATWAWVNYSAPGSANGTVVVWADYEGHAVELRTIAVPALADPWPYVALAAGALVAAPVVAVLAVRRRRNARAAARTGPAGPGEAPTEEELRRLAEGRDHVLGRASVETGSTLDELSEGFPGRPPTVDEMTEWVASLLADGSLRTALGPDGRSRFFRTQPAPVVPPPRVELDDRALEEALKRYPDDEEPPASDD